MAPSASEIRPFVKRFAFENLFIDLLGWDRCSRQPIAVVVDGATFTLAAIAEKRGVVVLRCSPCDDGAIPDSTARAKIDRRVAEAAYEHLTIFTDKAQTTQKWMWVRREAGKPAVRREHAYHVSQPGDSLIQKLRQIAFELDEEENLTHTDATARMRVFDIEQKITKKFYDRFQKEHAVFLEFIKGIPDEDLWRWYASVMLNRLMFIYFIQKKGFLGNDLDYLRTQLRASPLRGEDRYYRDFLRVLFFDGLATRKDDRSPAVRALIGDVPYLDGGLFLPHQIEERFAADIAIEDTAFERLFDFFEEYEWHLDTRPLRRDNEINPDVLGYIFEKYINQKQMGAYYTKEDITGYIARNTIIPRLLDMAREKCRIAFEGESAVWRLLREDPDRYIYPAMRHGITADVRVRDDGKPEPLECPREMPAEIAAGIGDVSRRGGWNRSAPEDYALPTEIWREVVARRQRYAEVRAKLASGEVTDVNDLVTLNLDIQQFAQDVVEQCEGSDLLTALWKSIEEITVLDPTCGSGAFLFAALNILEPLYEGCLERMEAFLDDLKSAGQERTQKLSHFRKILDRVAKHPNRPYFVLKSIMVNNLFGVDIMEEATEICKLRLFLKLVAEVEDAEHIEPLPDIDFNIRAGNTLVGFATYAEAEKAVTSTFLHGEIMKRIRECAADVGRLFAKFREQQTELGGAVRTDDRDSLLKGLAALEEELNGYLAKAYLGESWTPDQFEKWRKSHQPFHWFVNFYEAMNDVQPDETLKHRGFDVIIGNPPYLDLRMLTDYKARGFVTEITRNLCSLIIERCRHLVNGGGYQGYILPVATTSTEGYLALQKVIKSRDIVVSSFDDRPDHLFSGLDKNTLSVVIILCSKGTKGDYSTRLSRWCSEERETLFSQLQHHTMPACILPGCMPKIGSAIEDQIYDRIFYHEKPLATFYVRNSDYVVYYSRKINAFLQAMDFVPEVRDGHGRRRDPSELKELRFANDDTRNAVLCLLNSTIYRWFIDAATDGSHVNRREVDLFPFDAERAVSKSSDLNRLAKMLSERLKITSETRRMRYQHDTLTIQCIIPKFSKPTIDEIDRVLAKHYGFTDEELDFIINYDIKYRMGAENLVGDEDGEAKDRT